MRILIVDDSRDIQLLLMKLLKNAGYTELVTSRTAPEAFDLLGLNKPLQADPQVDLILMDIMMPGIDGIEACRRIKASAVLQDIPIIMVSSDETPERLELALGAGAMDYIIKPFKRVDLQARVKSALALKQESDSRKRAYEEALAELSRLNKLILNSVGDGIFGLDLQGRITFINPAGAEITGWSIQQAIGKSHQVILDVPSSDSPHSEASCPVCCALNDGIVWNGVEDVFQRKGATGFPVEYSSTPIRNELGEIVGAVVTFQDITRRKKMEEQLIQSQKMESVGRLAGGVAHEFNNRLTVIVAYSSMAMNQVAGNDDMFSFLEHIQDAGDRAKNITRQLLAFSRKQMVERKVVDLNDVIAEIVDMISPLVGEEIELVMPDSLDVHNVNIDPGHLNQVLLNLAINARDSMPLGGQITVSASNFSLDQDYAKLHPDAIAGEYAVLTVSDTETGITDEVKEHLFEPFFTTKEVGQGTGLGLATCYGIIKQNGGHITVYSELGHGTAFRIYLPSAGEASVTMPSSSETTDLPKGWETVLLVEDEESVREITAKILRVQGYRVLDANTGFEALSVAQGHAGEEIHLLLTDVVMPKMGGRELAERLLKSHSTTKVLYTSGYTSDTIIRHGVLDAEVNFLEKPFTHQQLVMKVREVLDE